MKIHFLNSVTSSRTTLAAIVCVALASCGGPDKSMQQQGPRELATITVEATDATLDQVFPATIKGRQDIEIRPQVSGFITKLCVDEGSVVRKGQTLFIIDPVQYEAAVKVAEAAVKVAGSNVSTAKLTADNKRELQSRNIISEYELQMAENDLATKEALLAQADAQLVNARKNLSYTSVTSPSNGVVGSIPFRVGSLVGPTITIPMTTVSDNSEMFAYFSMNEKQILEMMRAAGGQTKSALSKLPQVSLKLADGSIFASKGKIETLSGVIDPATGAASVRASFPNTGNVLRSGSTGQVLIPTIYSGVMVIPQKATYEIQDKKFVYLLSDSSTVQAWGITVSPLSTGSNYIVTSGLKSGDRIVVEGISSIRNGMKIKPITPEESAARIEAITKSGAGAGQQAKPAAK